MVDGSAPFAQREALGVVVVVDLICDDDDLGVHSSKWGGGVWVREKIHIYVYIYCEVWSAELNAVIVGVFPEREGGKGKIVLVKGIVASQKRLCFCLVYGRRIVIRDVGFNWRE